MLPIELVRENSNINQLITYKNGKENYRKLDCGFAEYGSR